MLHSSLPTHSGIIAVLYVLLSAVAVVTIDLRLVLIPTACAVLGLIASGFIVFRPLKAGFVIGWPAQTDPEELGVVIINGNPCPFEGYERDLLVEFRPRRVPELLGCFMLAAAVLSFILLGHSSSSTSFQIGPFEAEIICLAGLMVLLTSLRWFAERRFLRLSRITFGSILGIDPGFFLRGVTYQFFDQEGQRRGGRGPLSSDNTDNGVLVLYQPSNPDINTIHRSFVFHHFEIALLPGRRKRTVANGAKT